MIPTLDTPALRGLAESRAQGLPDYCDDPQVYRSIARILRSTVASTSPAPTHATSNERAGGVDGAVSASARVPSTCLDGTPLPPASISQGENLVKAPADGTRGVAEVLGPPGVPRSAPRKAAASPPERRPSASSTRKTKKAASGARTPGAASSGGDSSRQRKSA